jgi:hypothetical protein
MRGRGLAQELLGEHSVQRGVADLARDQPARAQQALAAKAQVLEQAAGGRVARIDVGLDAAQAQDVEGMAQRKAQRFARQALALELGLQAVAGLGAALLEARARTA